MADKLTLEILIKTVLDAAGVKAGNDEIKKLTSSLESATESGKVLELTSDRIVSALEKQRSAAASAGKAWEQLSDAEKEAQRDAAQRALRMLEADEATKKTAASTQNLAKSLGTMKELGPGVQQIIGGLLTGNLIAVGQGISSISKAIVAASAATKAWLVDLALFAAAVAGLAAPFAVAIAAVRKYADDLEAANKRVLDNARDLSEKRKQILAEETAAIVAEYAKQVKAANEAADVAEKTQKRIAATYDQAAKKTEAERQLRDTRLNIDEENALKAAKTDKQRGAIKADFQRRRDSNAAGDKLADFNTSDYEGDVRSKAAQEAIDAARERDRAAQLGVRDLEREYEAKQSYAHTFGKDTGRAAEEARKAALDARDKLKIARGEADKVSSETSQTIATQQAIIDQAKDTKVIVGIQRQIHGAWKLVIPGFVEVATIAALLRWARNRTGYAQATLLIIAWLAHVLCYLDLALKTDFVYSRYESIIEVVAILQILAFHETLARCWSFFAAVAHEVRGGRGRALRPASGCHSILSKGAD